MHDSIRALRRSLRARKSDLIVRHGRVDDVVAQECAIAGACTLYMHTATSAPDRLIEHTVCRTASKLGVRVVSLWSGTLYSIHDVPFCLSKMPSNYITFREHVYQHGKLSDPLPPPATLPPLPSTISPGELPPPDEKHNVLGGEDVAQTHLRSYVRHSARRTTPGRAGAVHYYSDFPTPWLRTGCLSPRRLYHEVRSVAQRGAACTIYFQLLWRDFFAFLAAASCIHPILNHPRSAIACIK